MRRDTFSGAFKGPSLFSVGGPIIMCILTLEIIIKYIRINIVILDPTVRLKV